MRKYDHLFFDLDNTLWDFTTNSRLAMEHTIIQNKLLPDNIDFEDYFNVYELINHSLWSDYHNKLITKQNLIKDRFSRSFQKFGITGLNWEAINRKYLENMVLQTSLFPGTKDILIYLKEKGYRLYIITNGFKEVQLEKLANCGISDFFTKVFISEVIKTTKPDRRIFEHALKSCNASKSKSIMIGDSWETDIEGALHFGIDQIMFLNLGKHLIPDPIKSIKNLSKSGYIEIQPPIKTWFIDQITDLKVFL